MALPEFNQFGDLPEGVHAASLTEVVARFGTGTAQRVNATARLQRIYDLAVGTAALDRLVVFGSYVSEAPAPNDIDLVLVMRDEFHLDRCPSETLGLFDHNRAGRELGASIFWVRPGMLLGDSLDQFIARWQGKRDGRRRGIVEVRPS